MPKMIIYHYCANIDNNCDNYYGYFANSNNNCNNYYSYCCKNVAKKLLS